MESTEVRSRSLLVGAALFGAGAAVGAGATWLVMSAVGRHRTGGGTRPSSTTSTAAEDGGTLTSRERYSAQLRRILADLEARLTAAVDDLLAHFSVSCSSDAEQTDKSTSRKASPTPRSDERPRSKSRCVRFIVVPNVRNVFIFEK